MAEWWENPGQALADFSRTVQNNVNVGLPTIGRVGDKINQVAGGVKDFQGAIVDRAVIRPVTEIFGEVSGSNAQRQQDWQNRVAADAESQRLKEIADRTLAAQNADVSASSAAQTTRMGTSRSISSSFNWKAPGGPDTTDFLGL